MNNLMHYRSNISCYFSQNKQLDYFIADNGQIRIDRLLLRPVFFSLGRARAQYIASLQNQLRNHECAELCAYLCETRYSRG